MMNKMNNKGFLLAESLIVATFVITVLVYLFSQFKNLMIEYRNNYKYNTVENIYNLGSVSKFLSNNDIVINSNDYIYKDGNCTDLIPVGNQDNLKKIVDVMKLDYLIYADSNIDNVKNNMSSYDQDMQDFIEKINTKKINGKGRLIAKFQNGNFATILIETNKSNLYVSDSGNDLTGYGTIQSPYKTISKAYIEASPSATIYIMSDITQEDKIEMNNNKNITLTSCTANSTKTSCTYSSSYSVTRGSSYTNGTLFDITTGTLTTTQITISGNNVGSTRALIIDRSNLIVNEGTTITKGKNTNNDDHDIYGGCVMVYDGNMTMNDGTISDCSTNGFGGAIITRHTSSGTTSLSLKGGTITGNKASQGGGLVIGESGNFEMSGGSISNNTASNIGGGVWCNGTCLMSGGTISENEATTKHAGGVYIYTNGNFTLNGGVIKKNKAQNSVNGGGIILNINSESNARYNYISGYVCKNNTPNNQYDTTASSNSNCA